MKRVFAYLAILLFAVVSCTSTEYIDVDETEPILIMNALMDTRAASHGIFLSRGALATVKREDGATVKVSINGDDPKTAVVDVSGGTGGVATRYNVTCTFNPGDYVEVEAVGGELNVKSSFIVPSLPRVKDISVLENVPHTVTSPFDAATGSGSSTDVEDTNWNEILLSFEDIPGEDNFYRIDVKAQYSEGIYPLYIDNSSDPVFGTAISSTNFIDLLTAESNSYNIFSDVSLKDGSYTAKLFYRRPEIQNYTLQVTLYSMTLQEYLYFKAYGRNELGGLFSEAVSVPSNVDGGLGFVSVSSAVFRSKEF